MGEMTGNCINGRHHTCGGRGGVAKNHQGKDTRYECSCPCHKKDKR